MNKKVTFNISNKVEKAQLIHIRLGKKIVVALFSLQVFDVDKHAIKVVNVRRIYEYRIMFKFKWW